MPNSSLDSREFPEANVKLLKPDSMTDEECTPLYVYSTDKLCISCWRFNWYQRILVLLFGRIWLCVHGGKTQPPVWLDCARNIFVKPEESSNGSEN